MYSMIPFGRMNTSWNDLFDDFERRMFPADRGELPAFRQTSGTRATTSCWRPTCPASGRRTSTCTFRTAC